MPSGPAATKRSYHHGDLPKALLEAAEAELAAVGIEAFSLRSVAKRAGVSHGAPSHHFGDANGLLTALAARGYRQLVEAQQQRKDAAKADPVSQFVASGLGYIDFAEANPAVFRLMFSSERPDRSDPAFAEASLTAYAHLEESVDAVLGLNEPPSDESASSRQLVTSWALVHGLCDLLISGRLSKPLGTGVQEGAARDALFSQMLRRALPGAPEAGARPDCL